MSPPKAAAKEPTRTNDPERTKANIMEVAAAEFGEKGLAGARIDEIAAATNTSKRMIYYYFGSKEGLYLAVLEESYRRVRGTEGELHLEDLEPEQALRRLVASGTQLRPYPREVLAALYKAAQELYAEIGAQNARFKRIHDHWDKFRLEESQWFRVVEDSAANFVAAVTAVR